MRHVVAPTMNRSGALRSLIAASGARFAEPSIMEAELALSLRMNQELQRSAGRRLHESAFVRDSSQKF